MRFAVSILGLVLLGGTAVGQVAPLAPTPTTLPGDKNVDRQKKVADAVENAVGKLYEDLGRQQVFGKVTIRDFVVRTDSEEALKKALRDADQIGGPRWID